jgi:hypothetical protein
VKECAISPTARAGAALPTISRTIHENLTTEPPSVEPFEVRSSLLRALFCGITVDFRLVAAPRTALTNTSTDFSKIVASYILTFPALVRMAVNGFKFTAAELALRAHGSSRSLRDNR